MTVWQPSSLRARLWQDGYPAGAGPSPVRRRRQTFGSEGEMSTSAQSRPPPGSDIVHRRPAADALSLVSEIDAKEANPARRAKHALRVFFIRPPFFP